jgi:hypothetical protein
MPTRDAPLNRAERFVNEDGTIADRAYTWLRDLKDTVGSSPTQATTPIVFEGATAKNAAIGLTSIPADVLGGGYYRITTWLRLTVAAGVSSSVTITIHFNSGAIVCTFPLTALTANAVNAPVSDTRLLKIDGGSPVSYSVAYASNPAAAAFYEMALHLERVST